MTDQALTRFDIEALKRAFADAAEVELPDQARGAAMSCSATPAARAVSTSARQASSFSGLPCAGRAARLCC